MRAIRSYKSFGLLLGLWSSVALASNNCGTTPSSSPGNNQVMFELNDLQPYYAVGVGEVLGTAGVSASILCYLNHNKYAWVLQIVPKGVATYDEYTCDSPLDGVGVRYKREDGSGVRCNSRGQLLTLADQKVGQNYPLNMPVAVEFIRTKSVTSLPPGSHTMRLPPMSVIESHLDGGSISNSWGSYLFKTSIPLVVSTCTFASATTNVEFGNLSIVDIEGANVPFSIGINNCGDAAAAKQFNDATKFSFSAPSVDLSPEGHLKNQICVGCAKLVTIKLTDDNGVFLPLYRKYELKDGTFLIDGETITHHFRAQLLNRGGGATAGRIQAAMAVTFSSI